MAVVKSEPPDALVSTRESTLRASGGQSDESGFAESQTRIQFPIAWSYIVVSGCEMNAAGRGLSVFTSDAANQQCVRDY